jgi:hypothetical protein
LFVTVAVVLTIVVMVVVVVVQMVVVIVVLKCWLWVGGVGTIVAFEKAAVVETEIERWLK